MNDKIVIFDLFDTLLTKVWFDYDKGLAYLGDTYLDGKREELKFYAKEYRERFMLKRNETQIETSFIKQLEFYERKFEKALSKPYDEIEWEFFSVCREETVAVGAKDLLNYLCERGSKALSCKLDRHNPLLGLRRCSIEWLQGRIWLATSNAGSSNPVMQQRYS